MLPTPIAKTYASGVTGLCIGKLEDNQRWYVMHVDTGMPIYSGWKRRKDAKEFANRLDAQDWTLPLASLAANTDLAQTVIQEAMRLHQELMPPRAMI